MPKRIASLRWPLFLAVGVVAVLVVSRRAWLPLIAGLWRTVSGAAANWVAVLAGLPRGLLVALVVLGVLVSLVTTVFASLLRPRRAPTKPVQMTFGGSPDQLRGTVRAPRQNPDGSWTATTTDRQTAWLEYQARRQGIQPQRKEE